MRWGERILFLICHLVYSTYTRAVRRNMGVTFTKAALLLARLCLRFDDACPSRIYCDGFVELRVVHSSSNRLRYIF
jgi:hypothetical protein